MLGPLGDGRRPTLSPGSADRVSTMLKTSSEPFMSGRFKTARRCVGQTVPRRDLFLPSHPRAVDGSVLRNARNARLKSLTPNAEARRPVLPR